MNINELIEKENTEHEKKIKALSLCIGLDKYIRFTTNGSIFTENLSKKEFEYVLHSLRQRLGKFKIDQYYIGSDNTLVVRYCFDLIKISMSCTEVEEMLNKISNGKCRIEKKVSVTTNTVKHIICSL